MNDLFDTELPVLRSSEKFAQTSELLLKLPKGKGKFGSTELSLPRKSGKFGELPFSLVAARSSKMFDLRATAERLANEIEIAEAEAAGMCAIQEPFKDAFWQAHIALEELHRLRHNGPGYPDKKTLLAAYDRRMLAGYHWYPHREPYKAVLRWLKALRSELKYVNSEIGT